MENKYYSVPEIAGMLSINQDTVRRWIHSDKLKAVKNDVDSCWYVCHNDLQTFLESKKVYFKHLRRLIELRSLENNEFYRTLYSLKVNSRRYEVLLRNDGVYARHYVRVTDDNYSKPGSYKFGSYGEALEYIITDLVSEFGGVNYEEF